MPAYDIPADAQLDVKMYLRAQQTVQAAFHAFDDPNVGTREILDVVLFAASMLIAVDRGNETRKDIRDATERAERLMQLTAEALQADKNLPELAAHLGIAVAQAQ